MTEPFDYTEHGLSRLPEACKQPNAVAYFSVFTDQLIDNEIALHQLFDAFLNWQRTHNKTFDFVLDTIGQFLGQVRPSGFDNDRYLPTLIARSISRSSNGTRTDLVRLLNYITRVDGGLGLFAIDAGPLEHWTIIIFNDVLSDVWHVLLLENIYAAIASTDSFELTFGNGNTMLFDDETKLYDQAGYAP